VASGGGGGSVSSAGGSTESTVTGHGLQASTPARCWMSALRAGRMVRSYSNGIGPTSGTSSGASAAAEAWRLAWYGVWRPVASLSDLMLHFEMKDTPPVSGNERTGCSKAETGRRTPY